MPHSPDAPSLVLCITACPLPEPLPDPSLSAHLLEATGAAAAATVEWAEQAQHLSVPGVHHTDTKGPAGATAQTGTAVALFSRLTQGLSGP